MISKNARNGKIRFFFCFEWQLWEVISFKSEKRLNAEVHTTQELNLLVILPDLSCEKPRVRRHLNVKIQN